MEPQKHYKEGGKKNMNANVLKAKQDLVAEIVNKFKASQAVIIAEYRGLSVSKAQELRRAIKKENSTMNVYKNSLVERAAKEMGYDQLVDVLTGPNAIFFSEELSSGPKTIAKYAKRYGDALVIKGGVVDGKFYNGEEMIALAKLPNKEGLISMLLSCLQAPVRQFACAVKAVADAK